MGERLPAGDGNFDVNSFDEWLEELAQQKNVQKQDILNQMVSSYWILDDLMGLASETGAQSNRNRLADTDDPSDRDRGEHDPTESKHDEDEDPVLVGDGDSSDEEAGQGESASEIDTEAVAAILETLRENTEHRSQASGLDGDPDIDTLWKRVNEIESDVQSQFDDLTTRQQTQDSELRTLFEWLENHDESIADIRSQLRPETESLESKLDELESQNGTDAEKLADLESKVEDIETSLEEITQRRDEALDAIESELRSDIDALENQLAGVDPDTGAVSALEADIETLKTKLEAVEKNREEALGALESDFAADMEALRQKLAEIEPRVENIDRVESAIETLESKVGELETQTQNAASNGDLADVSQQVVALEEETTNRFESLQTNLQAEFDQLKTILDELFDTQQRIASEMEVLQSSYDEEVPPLTQIEEEYNAVADLKDTANNKGISVAKCGGCDTTVDIGLLSRPNCPNCEATFTDVSPKKGWFGGSDTLVTESRKPPVPDDSDFQ